MKKLYIALLLLISSQLTIAQNPNFEWAKQMGGTSWDEGYSITTDANGNVYTTGFFVGTVDFDPGTGIANLTSVGQDDFFIQKLDTAGNFLWVKQMGGTLSEGGLSITTDAQGNVYTTGRFDGTVDFDPGVGTTYLTSVGSTIGMYDIFIQKLDSAGNFLWVKQMGGTSGDNGSSITVDAVGNVYTTGSFSETADFNPGAGTVNLTSAGMCDIFIQKLDSAGNFLWVKKMGGTSYDYGCSITTDGYGNVYTTGTFENTVDFNPGTGIVNLTSAGHSDIFIQKLDSAGNFLWVKQMGGTSLDYGRSITLDADYNVYSTGSFRGTVDFDPGFGTANLTCVFGSDIFIQKLDSAGNFSWVKQVGGGMSGKYGKSITTDASDNVYTTGYFEGTADFDPGSGTANLTSAGGCDIFIQKLNTAGNLLWVKQMGGITHDYGHSITIDADYNVYSTGTFEGTVDFDPGVSITNLISAGYHDIFIQKLSQCVPNTGIDDIAACDTYTWIDSITYTASNNTATHTLSNAGGCDSVVTLNLIIDTVDISVNVTDPTITANAIGASYQWLDCNNNFAIITGEIAQSFTATANGDYAVEIKQNLCTDTSMCVAISTVGINEDKILNQVSIYPNPTKGIVNINFGNFTNVNIKLSTTTGQIVYEKENINVPDFQFELNVIPGIYFIEISSQYKKQNYKLLIK